MTWLDVVVLAIVALSAVFGIVRGFIREVLSLLVWVLSFWVAFRYSHESAVYLERYIQHEDARLVAAFVALFFAVLLVGMLISGLIVRVARFSGIGGPDRALGAAFGLLRGVLLVTVLVLVTAITPLAESEAWTGSLFMDRFETLADWTRDAVHRETGVELPAPGTATSPQAPGGG